MKLKISVSDKRKIISKLEELAKQREAYVKVYLVGISMAKSMKTTPYSDEELDRMSDTVKMDDQKYQKITSMCISRLNSWTTQEENGDLIETISSLMSKNEVVYADGKLFLASMDNYRDVLAYSRYVLKTADEWETMISEEEDRVRNAVESEKKDPGAMLPDSSADSREQILRMYVQTGENFIAKSEELKKQTKGTPGFENGADEWAYARTMWISFCAYRMQDKEYLQAIETSKENRETVLAANKAEIEKIKDNIDSAYEDLEDARDEGLDEQKSLANNMESGIFTESAEDSLVQSVKDYIAEIQDEISALESLRSNIKPEDAASSVLKQFEAITSEDDSRADLWEELSNRISDFQNAADDCDSIKTWYKYSPWSENEDWKNLIINREKAAAGMFRAEIADRKIEQKLGTDAHEHFINAGYSLISSSEELMKTEQGTSDFNSELTQWIDVYAKWCTIRKYLLHEPVSIRETEHAKKYCGSEQYAEIKAEEKAAEERKRKAIEEEEEEQRERYLEYTEQAEKTKREERMEEYRNSMTYQADKILGTDHSPKD